MVGPISRHHRVRDKYFAAFLAAMRDVFLHRDRNGKYSCSDARGDTTGTSGRAAVWATVMPRATARGAKRVQIQHDFPELT